MTLLLRSLVLLLVVFLPLQSWAAAAYRSSNATTYASRTNTTLTAPSGIADGDNLIIVMLFGAATEALIPTPTPPTGFTAMTGFPVTVNENNNPLLFSVRTYAWRKIAASESGDYTTTHTAISTDGYIVAVSGGTTGSVPNPSIADGDGTGDMTTPSITTVTDNSLILYWAHNWELFGSSAVPSGTTPTWTERLDSSSNLLYIADGVLATAGATGAKTKASLNTGAQNQWATGLIAIDDVSGAGVNVVPFYKRRTQ